MYTCQYKIILLRAVEHVHYLREKTARRVPTKNDASKISGGTSIRRRRGDSGFGANKKCWTRGREQKLTHKPHVFAFNPHVKSLASGLQGCEVQETENISSLDVLFPSASLMQNGWPRTTERDVRTNDRKFFLNIAFILLSARSAAKKLSIHFWILE